MVSSSSLIAIAMTSSVTSSSESQAENVHEVKVLAMKISKDLKAEKSLHNDVTLSDIGDFENYSSKWTAVNFWPGPTW